MVKKIISVATAFLMLCCMIPFGVFADDVLDVCPKCGERTFVTEKDISASISEAMDMPFSIKGKRCTSCNYAYYDWNAFGYTGYKEFSDGGYGLLLDYLKEWKDNIFGKNASAQIIDASNGGANIPAPGGRNPKGYGDEGKANVTASGVEVLWVEPFGLSGMPYFDFVSNAPYDLKAGRSSSGDKYPASYMVPVYYFEAPVSGLYYVGSSGSPYDFGTFNYYSNSKWNRLDLVTNCSSPYTRSVTLNKGDKYYFYASFLKEAACYKPYKFYLNNIPIFVDPTGDSSITTTNSITINNNTWNGNIYTDNSTNLTYIYPQYTTINEKNETVTNISNTPIIYNNETKQYYTYDTVTNNYYYITYEQPATPTPSPSPSPAPTETPSPSESPIPTPTPDPGTAPTSTPKPGGSISTPETGKPGGSSGSSWWDKLLDKLGNAVIDGLLGAVSAVLKLIFKLLSTILGWIIWAVSLVFTLFPFLPPGVSGLLVGGVVVCFVIGIIKFIRG